MRIDPAPPEVRSISPHKHDFPALDGLRGVAVLLVLLIHTAVPMTEGFPDDDVVQLFWSAIEPLYILGGTGVHLFFVLSGFLLFLPFARRLLVGGNKPRTGLFYRRRLLRILPAYYMALVLVWAVFERDTIVEPFKQFATHALLIHNYSWLTYRGLNVPTWTMAVESQFYLLLPLLGAAAVWLFSRSRMALGIGIGLLVLSGPLASVLARALVRLLPGFEQHEPILETLRFMSTFGMGLVAACVYVLAKDARVSAAVQQRLSRWGLVVFVVTFTVYVGRGWSRGSSRCSWTTTHSRWRWGLHTAGSCCPSSCGRPPRRHKCCRGRRHASWATSRTASTFCTIRSSWACWCPGRSTSQACWLSPSSAAVCSWSCCRSPSRRSGSWSARSSRRRVTYLRP